MIFLPVVARELSVLARQKSTYWLRVAAAFAGGLLIFWLLLAASSRVSLAGRGPGMFLTLSSLAFVYALFAGARGTADSLSAEKREGTLGLLFLTDLKGYDVVLGKLVSSSINTLYGLLAVVPVLAVVLLLGGVSPGQMARVALVLVNTLFLSLSVGMFVSALSHQDRKAMFGTVFVMVFLAGAPFVAGRVLAVLFSATGFQMQQALICSPFFTFAAAQEFRMAAPEFFFPSLALTHGMAWFFLALAAWILPRSFQVGNISARMKAWEQFQQLWTFGSGATRTGFRRQWLDRNPFAWLAIRDRSKFGYVWLLLICFLLIWIWIYWIARVLTLEASVVLLIAIHLVLKTWITIETCRRWIEDRENGALELLLTAPVQIEALARGQGKALRRQFFRPVLALTGLTLALCLIAYKGAWLIPRNENIALFLLAATAVFLADMTALRWTAAWAALRTRTLNRAMLAALARIIALRSAVFLALAVPSVFWTMSVARRPFDFAGLILFWAGLALLLDAVQGWSSRGKFLTYFRFIASEPGRPWRAFKPLPVTIGEQTSPHSELSADRTRARPGKPWTRARAGLVMTPLLLILSFGGYHWLLQRRIQSELSQITRAGHPVDGAQLRKWRHPPLKEDEFAALDHLRAAFNSGVAQLHQLPGNDFRDLKHLLNRRKVMGPAFRPAMAAYLERNEPLVSALREENILQRISPRTDWREWVLPNGFNSPYAPLIHLSELLRLEVMFYAGNHPGRAAAALGDSFSLASIMQSLPHNGIRQIAFNYAIQSLEFFLSQADFSAGDLERAEDGLVKFGQRISLEEELLSHLCLGIELFHNPSGQDRFGPGVPEWQRILLHLVHQGRKITGNHQRDFLEFLKTGGDGLALLQQPWETRWASVARLRQSAGVLNGRSFHPSRVAGSVNAPLLDSFDFVGRLQSLSGAAQISLALERHRLGHQGRLPETLEQLVPDLLTALPLDPFDGAPLRYLPSKRSYIIYSIGPDARDDTGSKSDAGYPPDDITFTVVR